jgi:transposase
MWTVENRSRYERRGLRYPTDLTDEEWALTVPHIRPATRGGRRRTTDMREVVNAILYLLGTGCNGGRCPRISRPARRCSSISTVGNGTAHWNVSTMPFMSPCASRRIGRRVPRLQSSTVRAQRARKKGACLDPIGYDAGKKIKGKKRHILVDTLGLMLNVVVHPADVQDRDGGLLVLQAVRRLFPFVERIFADGGYQGAPTAAAVRALGP